MALRVVIALAALCFAAPAQAARIPTAAESEALNGLLRRAIGDRCDSHLTKPVPLISDDRTWGRIGAVCGPPGGAGAEIFVWGVWAHRSRASAADWRVVGRTNATREPVCTGEGGLLNLVPLAVVRDLRETCLDPASGKGYRPSPNLRLEIYPSEREPDAVGPLVVLSSNSEVNRGGRGGLIVSKNEPPLGSGSTLTLADVTEAFGKPRRTACRARWARIALSATACASEPVTKLTLGRPWRVSWYGEVTADSTGASVRVGDHVTLARYLDRGLRELRANHRLSLPRLRIGSSDVTATVVARHARIRAIEIVFAPVP